MTPSAHLEMPLNAVDQHVGARLRARRLMLQVSEDWLAGSLQVSLAELEALETGRSRITHEQLLQLAETLDVAERYFYLGFDGGRGGGVPQGKRSWLREVDRWFRDHVSPHEGIFYQLARMMTGSSDQARDLVHDAYAQILADDRWRSVENPRAYVKRVVANLGINLVKRSKVVPMEQFLEADVLSQVDIAPDAFQALAGRERLRQVIAAIDSLPPQCRKVVSMRKLEELSIREIARRLGLSVKTVEGHLAKGMVLLNRHLEIAEQGATVTFLPVASQDGKNDASVAE